MHRESGPDRNLTRPVQGIVLRRCEANKWRLQTAPDISKTSTEPQRSPSKRMDRLAYTYLAKDRAFSFNVWWSVDRDLKRLVLLS